jgi:hypothetical protein
MSSKNSCSNSNLDLKINEREINMAGIEQYMKYGSNKTTSKDEPSSRHMWDDSLRESNKNLSQAHIIKASNDFLFENDLNESKPNNPREIPLGFPDSFKNISNKEINNRNIPTNNRNIPLFDFNSKKNISEANEINLSNDEDILDDSSDSITKKKSITTVKNYQNIASSNVYSSPDPKHKKGFNHNSNQISTFKEVPDTLKESVHAKSSKRNVFDEKNHVKEEAYLKLKKKIQEQENDIAELETKNSNLNKFLEQQKKEMVVNKNNLEVNTKENKKKKRLLIKMKDILIDFRGRLKETIKSQNMTLNAPKNISFIEEQNHQFVRNAFNYEKILVKKLKELSNLKERESKLMAELEEKKHDNINLMDKIQVHKNKTMTQDTEITKLSDKIKDYQRIVENLEHEMTNKEMKLARKTRKYRNEIARAKRCGKCSQRSMRKIKGKNSEVLLNDLNQIKEESLSNYSETDSDHQEVNLNDYQEILDSRNEIQGRYNALMAKYLDCKNNKMKYKIKSRMLADKNIKYKKLLKEATTK